MLISARFLCGVTAAVLIWRGGENSKRVEEVRSRLLAALAEKHPLDRPLGQNHTGNSRPEVVSQTVMVTNIREKDISDLHQNQNTHAYGKLATYFGRFVSYPAGARPPVCH